MSTAKKSYTVMVISQNTWGTDEDGKTIPHIERTCEHGHRSLKAAHECHATLTKQVDGMQDANWFRGEIRNSDGSPLSVMDEAELDDIDYRANN